MLRWQGSHDSLSLRGGTQQQPVSVAAPSAQLGSDSERLAWACPGYRQSFIEAKQTLLKEKERRKLGVCGLNRLWGGRAPVRASPLQWQLDKST